MYKFDFLLNIVYRFSTTDLFFGLTINKPANASDPPIVNVVRENEKCGSGKPIFKLAIAKPVALEIRGDAIVPIPATSRNQPSVLSSPIINSMLSKINDTMTDIYTDGSGTGKYIYAVPDKKIVKISQKRGITHNEAEYFGVIQALTDIKDRNICIYSDSRLIVNQLNKDYKLKEPRMRKLAEQVWKLCEGRKIKFKWVPREKNVAGKILG